MKKVLALLLAMVLLTIAPLSLAETAKLTENASGFDLTVDMPTDATINIETNDDVPYTFITFSDATKPLLYISVAPTEEYTEASLSELSKEDLDSLFTMFSADLDDPGYKMKKTSGGYEYMLINDNSETDSALLVLLYNGFFIQVSVWNASYTELTSDDIAVAEALIDTLKIEAVQ